MFPAPTMFSSGFHHPQSPLPPPPPPVSSPWLQSLLSSPPSSASSLWNPETLHNHLRSLRETLALLKAVQRELEMVLALKESGGSFDDESLLRFSEEIKMKGVSLDDQELISVEAAKSLYLILKGQLAPLDAVMSEARPWEERSEAVRLAHKVQKHQRNKKWKKKKRRRVAEMLRKEHEMYDKADQEADEWRAREIAKDIAKCKMEKMKEIAKLKANEERMRLESEFELVLVVEKLQELRSIRIQKLKKQGHFLPEQDDEFLDRIRAAVEEEERQAAAAADTDAAKDAIASAEESRKATESIGKKMVDTRSSTGVANTGHDQLGIQDEKNFQEGAHRPPEQQEFEGQGRGEGYETISNLPLEFYHYYHGSNYDMGTLIEVRRAWDAYLRHGGSRIPGHWVQPSSPGNDVWASYLVGPKQ